jgi:2-hydroxychromene-2-carboxylate isomerase
MTRELEFWYELASTYSYLSVMRIRELAEREGVAIKWKPFLLGPIFKSQGWSTSAFNIYPAKGKYMWRDIKRLCTGYKIPFSRPAEFPRNGLLAARVALIAETQGWCSEFSKMVFQANFAEDKDISDEAVIASILDSLGKNGAQLIEHAKSDETKLKLRAQSKQAVEKGIFGAPTFAARDEIFWGNDRLEDALNWVKSERI